MKLLGVATATMLFGLGFGGTTASAQSFGVYVGPGGGTGVYYSGNERYRDRGYRNGPRVYGYTREYRDDRYYGDSDDRPLRRSTGGCGTYYFWDGDSCVDARRR